MVTSYREIVRCLWCGAPLLVTDQCPDCGMGARLTKRTTKWEISGKLWSGKGSNTLYEGAVIGQIHVKDISPSFEVRADEALVCDNFELARAIQQFVRDEHWPPIQVLVRI